MRRIYMDHSATTPVHPEVAQIIQEHMVETYGNPSSIHSFGRDARKSVEHAREAVARLIGADEPREIIFTSGGTEADNMALKGVAAANRRHGKHIITSAIEHHAVLHTCEWLEKQGYDVTYLPVDKDGLVDPTGLKEAVRDDTILVSIMLANNEVGTVQPLEEISAITKERGIYLHTDAVQAVGNIPVDVNKLGVDLLSLSGHKIYGPKGIGALYIRRKTKMEPLFHGGSHERRLRSGTENVPGIVGLGKAAELALAELDERATRNRALRDRLLGGIMKRISDVKLNGHPSKRLPNNANVSFLYVEGESILLNLDMKGIAASSGSACTSGSLEPSHVLTAMGIPHEVAHGSVRFSLGRENTEEDVDYVVEVLVETIARLRDMSPLYSDEKESVFNVQ